ncbi:hypothetical protein DSUL_100145 [Desulfovibrionales bacterium]
MVFFRAFGTRYGLPTIEISTANTNVDTRLIKLELIQAIGLIEDELCQELKALQIRHI